MVSRLMLLNFAALVFMSTIFLLNPILPIYLYRDLGASEQEVGLIIPLTFLVSAFLRIPCSMLIRRNILQILLFGLGLNAASIAGYGLSWNPSSFSIFRAIHGISTAVSLVVFLTAVEFLANPGELEKAVAGYTASLALGFWLGPLIGVFLRGLTELRIVLLATALIAAIPVVVVILLLRDLRGAGEAWKLEVERQSIKLVLKRPNILLALTYLSFSLAAGAVTAYGPLKAKLFFRLEDQLVILLFLSYYVTAFVARIILLKSPLSARLGLGNLTRIALASSILGVLLIGLAEDLPSFSLGLTLTGFAHGLVFPLTASAVAQATPRKQRVLGNSLHLTAFDLGSLLGSTLVAILLAYTGLSNALALTCIFPALGMVPASLSSRYIDRK